MEEFVFPEAVSDLWSADSNLPVKPSRLRDLCDFAPNQIADLADQISFSLCDQDPLCITEQQVLDGLCSLLRQFSLVPAARRSQLVDSLCSSLTCLTPWMERALASASSSSDAEADLGRYRSALGLYVFSLAWALRGGGEDGNKAGPAPSLPPAKPRRKRAGAAEAADDSGAWDASPLLPKALSAVCTSLSADLWVLYRPAAPPPPLLSLALQLAAQALCAPGPSRAGEVAAAAGRLLALLSARYAQTDAAAAAVAHAVSRCEHAPAPAAEALRAACEAPGGPALAGAVLAELAGVDAAEYERQQGAAGDPAGVRSVAAFVEEAAARWPGTLAAHVALLLPHLGGRAHSLRSAIVAALGELAGAAEGDEASEGASEAATHVARRRQRRLFLSILLQRVLDAASYTRKAALAAWTGLLERRSVPIAYWEPLAAAAVGRLQDKSSLVRREAMRLLGAMLLHNPFGPSLPREAYEQTLAVHAEMLRRLGGGEEGAGRVGGEEGAGRVGGEERPKGERQSGDALEQPLDIVKAERGADEELVEEETEAEPAPALAPRDVGWEGSVPELQALVASLSTAAAFCSALSQALPLLRSLLGSATLSDVGEAVSLLLTLRQFNVEGAAGALRSALPLVLSPEPGVAERVVDTLARAHVLGWPGAELSTREAAESLAQLAAGASVGELAALEEALLLMHRRALLPDGLADQLWALAERAAPARPGDEAARLTLRGSLQVLAVLAGAQPGAASPSRLAQCLDPERQALARAVARDALCVRALCEALVATAAGDAGRVPPPAALRPFLLRQVLRPVRELAQGAWFAAAEACLRAACVLDPAPERLLGVVLEALRREAAGTGSPAALARFFFALGLASLQQLVLVEAAAREALAADRERRAAQRAAEGGADVEAEMGLGDGAAAAALDALRARAERAVLEQPAFAAGARLVGLVCAAEAGGQGRGGGGGSGGGAEGAAAAAAPPTSSLSLLQSASMLALAQTCVSDARLLDAQARLLFGLLSSPRVPGALRASLCVALGDLAQRFPNAVEPWTAHMYAPLRDADALVRRACLQVLSHLVLNDAVRVKGHAARLAALLADPEPAVAAQAAQLFDLLARKEVGRVSTVVALFPDVLSVLSSERELGREAFESVMGQLLAHVKKDRQGDALAERLAARVAAAGDDDPHVARGAAYCLAQLPLGERGLKKVLEGLRAAKRALGDARVADTLASWAQRLAKGGKPELRALAEEMEAAVRDARAELEGEGGGQGMDVDEARQGEEKDEEPRREAAGAEMAVDARPAPPRAAKDAASQPATSPPAKDTPRRASARASSLPGEDVIPAVRAARSRIKQEPG